jgi:predicted ATP-grasp superfamily ATP-dependent carboligase
VADVRNLLIFGASARAAAFSALRAGLTPWCADLFADADLVQRCSVRRLPAEGYPRGFVALAESIPSSPWLYTGALENHPDIIATIARRRPLWGVDRRALEIVRSPSRLCAILESEGIRCPAISEGHVPNESPGQARWLRKPLRGAGGTGIHWWRKGEKRKGRQSGHFLQEYIEGESRAACFVGTAEQAIFLGATRQFIGENWLHAAAFHYCGSIGPLILGGAEQDIMKLLGNVLAVHCGLRGIFGVDYIVRGGSPWPVEVNPRYTASVEVLEYGAGVPAMSLHRAVFDPDAPPANPKPRAAGLVGKAILFARAPVNFPNDGPWTPTLRSPSPIEDIPEFADIPHAGEPIEARRPILTFFARAETETACLEELKAIAADLDRWLFER